ncbi:MAG: hypothetical protein MUF15_05945, partial [Acidobacteria bacterium]|nr:hypothetical protein [Acidobacteriota bacterium]
MNKPTLLKQESIVAATYYTKERDYWAQKLAGDIVKSTFPYDHDTYVICKSNKKTINFDVDDETV